MATPPELEEKLSINIQLGDIIKIIAPTDTLLNEHIYFVKYLDKSKLVLIQENGNETSISFDESGKLDNEAITSIEILSRSDTPSYAKQNNLVVGKWIDIYFGGDVPIVFTGQITNVEEDMIEIKTYPDNEIIFIDFGYKGLPPDLNIEKIVGRDAPSGLIGQPPPATNTKGEGAEGTEVEGAKAEGEIEGTEVEGAEAEGEIVDSQAKTPRQPFRDLFLRADQIKIGTELASILQEVEVPESEQRFGIDKQTNDLLDDLLSSIPNTKRTETVLNDIHKMIERFKQLRTEFSKFDEQGNALMPAIQGANFKPLVETLEKFNQKLYWILPVVKNKRKLYDVEIDQGEFDNENSDVMALTLAQVRNEEEDIIQQYNDGRFPSEENKYAFLIKSLNPFLTPFTDPNNNTDTITTDLTHTNITTIVDNITTNLTHFYSSVAGSISPGAPKDELADVKQRRFVMENYNLGMTNLEMNKIKGGDILIKRKQLTVNDKLTLKSFLMLPEATVRFSQINMPSTNLLIKSNLNTKYLNYSRLLKKNTAVATTVVDNLEKPIDYESEQEQFLTSIKEFILDETMNDPEKYKKYLDVIIPKTRVLFDLVRPYINGKLSIYNVLTYLEPFMIYQRDLSFKQYESINNFISEKIVDFKRNYILRLKEFNTLNNSRGYSYTYIPNLVKLFQTRQELREKVLIAYGIDTSLVNLTDGEFLKKINDIDNGRLYNDAISLMATSLMGNTDGIADLFLMKTQYEKNKVAIKEAVKDDTCGKYRVIAKHYIEMDEMEDDNDRETYFDKKYDTTYYDIIKEYKFDPAMSLPERIVTLTKKLMEKNGLRENEARREAQAMIHGKRVVEDGDYAIFDIKDPDGNIDFNYYLRVNGKWERDNSIAPQLMTDTAKMFCNLNEKCIQVKNDCLTVPGIGETVVKNNTLKQMVDELGKYSDYNETTFFQELEPKLEQIEKTLKEAFEEADFRIGKLSSIRLMKLFKYDEEKFKIGASAEENMSVTSPYLKLRDAILGQGDFVKRQLDILKFVSYFTREANVENYINVNDPNEVESPYWYYCNKTNTKLMPTFLVKIANAYTNNENFSQLIERICTEQGTISEDGNTWVDKYSGYIIRNINFNTEDEYNEDGFKDQTRAVMEADLGEALLRKSQTKPTKEYDSPFAKSVANIIITMARETGVTMDQHKDFIIKNVIEQQGKIMPSKELYQKKFDAATGKGKPIAEYDTAFNTSLIILTLCYFLIALQISIPSIKTRKTFPGCVRSFTGFPLNDKVEDQSSITYIACIANKVKSAVEPWNALQKSNAKTIATRMENLLTTVILATEEVKVGIQNKRDYLQKKPVEEEENNNEHSINKWINFLPPLQPIKLTATVLQDVGEGFSKELKTALMKGVASQHEMLNIIRSKIITFSLGVIECIQKTVNKKTAIMVNRQGEPYLENACCDDGVIKTLQYFINDQPDIVKYNNSCVKLANILNDVGQMEKAGMFYDPTDTKFKFPLLSDDFSEDVIYKAFIVFCKYGNTVPISEELRSVCNEKPKQFNDSDPLDENIRKLKRDGHNYSMESLNQLLQIVNTNNLVKMNLHKTAVNSVNVLRDIIESMDSRDVQSHPKAFRELFIAVLNTFESGKLFEDTPQMRDFRKYLGATNEEMIKDIKNFIKKPSSGVKTNAIKMFNTCLDHITEFEETGDGMFMSREDETIYKVIDYLKNSLRSLTREFPNIIINNVDNTNVTIPKHWKLSEIHNSDLKKMISQHYASLNEFYSNNTIKLVMEKLKQKTRDTDLLAKNTLFFAPIQLDANKYMYSLFDRRLVIMLFKYYYLTVFTDLITLKDEDEILLRTVERPSEEEDSEDELLSVDATNDRSNGRLDEIEIIQGNKQEVSKEIASVVIAFASILCANKDVIDYNYQSLMERILRSKEKEKDIITNRLKDLKPEELDVEDVIKNLKLERWSKGLQKGLVTYQGKTYDEEREVMEKQTLAEIALGKNRSVTDRNRDIYMVDEAQAEIDNEAIEGEETRITYMGEDGEPEDYDMDGDEDFY